MQTNNSSDDELDFPCSSEYLHILSTRLKSFHTPSPLKKATSLSQLKDTIQSIIDMLIYTDKTPKDTDNIFDTFCELNLLNEFLYFATDYNNPEITIQLIKSISMLVLSLTSKQSLYYLFSNNFISKLISLNNRTNLDEEFLSYYINFLKSLILKLDTQTLTLFYIEKTNTFPLFANAMMLYNHKDYMVSNVVRTIFMAVCKINNTAVIEKYICSAPFAKYFCNIACNLREHVQRLYFLLVDITEEVNLNEAQEINDNVVNSILYLQDIFSLGCTMINNVLTNAVMFYFVMPCLIGEVVETQHQKICNTNIAVYILCLMFEYVRDEQFVNVLFSVMFSKRVPKELLWEFIEELPDNPEGYMYQIEGNMKSEIALKDNERENVEKLKEYTRATGVDFVSCYQSGNKSECLSFLDMMGKYYEYMFKCSESDDKSTLVMQPNEINVKLYNLFKSNDDTLFLLMNMLFSTVISNTHISPELKQHSNLLSFSSLSTISTTSTSASTLTTSTSSTTIETTTDQPLPIATPYDNTFFKQHYPLSSSFPFQIDQFLLVTLITQSSTLISIHSIHSLLLSATPDDIPQSYTDLLIKAYYTYYVPVIIDMITNNKALYEEAYRLIAEQYSLFICNKHKNYTKEYLRDISFLFIEQAKLRNEKEKFKRLILLFLYLNELIHQFNASKQLFVWKKNLNEDDASVIHETEYAVNAVVSLVDETSQLYHVFCVNVDDVRDYVMLIINDFILICENNSGKGSKELTAVKIVYKFMLRDVKVTLCDNLLPNKGNVFMLFNGKESKGSYYTMEIRYAKDVKDNDVICETIHSVIIERRKNVIEVEKEYVKNYFDSLLLEYTKSKN